MATPDDLTARCFAEVERAMTGEPIPPRTQARLALRLARMMAASVVPVAKAAYVIGALGQSERLHEVEYDFLTALRKANEP